MLIDEVKINMRISLFLVMFFVVTSSLFASDEKDLSSQETDVSANFLKTLFMKTPPDQKENKDGQSDEKKIDNKQNKSKKFSLAIKPAYYWPQEKIYRDLYGSGYKTLGEFCYNLYKSLNMFLEVGYFYKKKSVEGIGGIFTSSVQQVPVSLGLNYSYKFKSKFLLYLKMSPNYVYTKTKVHIPNIETKTQKHSFGGTFGAGGKVNFDKNIFLEIFVNYLLNRKTITDHNQTFKVWLGGIQTGAGLGILF